jgi:hypothetical protein
VGGGGGEGEGIELRLEDAGGTLMALAAGAGWVAGVGADLPGKCCAVGFGLETALGFCHARRDC